MSRARDGDVSRPRAVADRGSPPRSAPGRGLLFTPLHELPIAWRGLLVCVLLFLAGGYVAAQLNVYAQNERVDGVPGLGPRDLLLKYHGGMVEVRAGEAPPSRMLEMIAGAMRQYFSEDAHFEVLSAWLKAGATREAFAEGDPAPREVLIADCLRCHAADSRSEIATRSPFGPDLFTPDYELVSKHALAAEPGATQVYRPPRDWRELAMTTHAHMLSVPMFSVLLAGLFLWSGWPGGAWRWAGRIRALLACAPLTFFLLDVSFWWLARLPAIGAYFALAIGAMGALFGASFAVQWIVVMRAILGFGRAH